MDSKDFSNKKKKTAWISNSYVRFTNSFKNHCDVIVWHFSLKQSLIITGQFGGPSFIFSVTMSAKGWKQQMVYITSLLDQYSVWKKIQSVGCSSICIANMYDKLCLIYTPFLSTWKKSLKHHRSIIVALKHRSSLLLYLLCDIICYRGYFSIGRVWDQGSTRSLSRLKQFVKCRSLWQRSTDKQSR